MGLMRYLSESRIRLEMRTRMPSEEELAEIPRERWLKALKEQVIRELCELLVTSPEIRNANKLFLDLHNREKQWSTALGRGVAFPHVRTMHTRGLVFAVARSTPGLDFDAPDDEPVHLFFAMVCPPYEDQLYRRFAKQLAIAVTYGGLVEEALRVTDEGEMMRLVDCLV